ncbi:uncharacterized protein CPUR_05729 [Claviceps purpurea 20.1]|uniref:Uncharacterized protein n=1 Tax=Claviceps purpurea (strain 20.1) TaxID=1111077 RepID=M1WGK3_CLAP2|nr:uncharacterized protein CPUR_05729 [Claviceps purpurea 20.1]
MSWAVADRRIEFPYNFNLYQQHITAPRGHESSLIPPFEHLGGFRTVVKKC